jgi:DNA-directed RNA polymerase specialized sigma24 family protein
MRKDERRGTRPGQLHQAKHADPWPDDLLVTDLVTRAGNGDKQAWDALVDRYAPLIWSICRRHRLSDAAANDIGQSVWLRLVDHLGTVRHPGGLPGWLATTTRRECLRVLRAAPEAQAAGYVLDPQRTLDEQATTPEEQQQLLLAERHAALARGVRAPPSVLPAADHPTYRGSSRAVRPDHRQAGYPRRKHRAESPPLPR